uniref:Uncharacterized protein n=1 Tax=Arion vulgaris TaxID=1028688 RepID=A0A0B6ZUC4_9EUPU
MLLPPPLSDPVREVKDEFEEDELREDLMNNAFVKNGFGGGTVFCFPLGINF